MSDFLNWDSVIEADEPFVLLPEGEYAFTVKSFSRSKYTPRDPANSKIPECDRADFVLNVVHPTTGETAEVEDHVFMLVRFKWKLHQLFASIGQCKPGEPLVPNWQGAVGMSGRCKISVRTYTGSDGREYKQNQVAEYLPFTAPAAPAAPTWNPGSF